MVPDLALSSIHIYVKVAMDPSSMITDLCTRKPALQESVGWVGGLGAGCAIGGRVDTPDEV